VIWIAREYAVRGKRIESTGASRFSPYSPFLSGDRRVPGMGNKRRGADL